MPPRRTHKPQPTKRRSGARKKGSGSPGWLWLLGGTALGAIMAVALYFHDQPQPEHRRPHTQHKPDTASSAPSPQARDAERHLGDIFERLDDSKPKAVTAPPLRPANPAAPPAHNNAAAPTGATDSATPAAKSPAPPVTSKAPKPAAPVQPAKPPKPSSSGPRWWLQAGAFRSAGQADSLKARLTLTGLPVKVVSGRGSNNILWYRVRVGPYRDKDAVNRARQRLKNQKISPVLIKQ